MVTGCSSRFAVPPFPYPLSHRRRRGGLASPIAMGEGLGMRVCLLTGWLEVVHHERPGQVEVRGIDVRILGVRPTRPVRRVGRQTVQSLRDLNVGVFWK